MIQNTTYRFEYDERSLGLHDDPHLLLERHAEALPRDGFVTVTKNSNESVEHDDRDKKNECTHQSVKHPRNPHRFGVIPLAVRIDAVVCV